MKGEQFHIALVDDAKLFCVKTPRTIPYTHRGCVSSGGAPTPLAHRCSWWWKLPHIVKTWSDMGMGHLWLKWVRHLWLKYVSTQRNIFTKINTKKGYHQCPLDRESQDLTTFINPFGRFKFVCAPYGISSISKDYKCRMDKAFIGLPGFRCVIDNIMIYDHRAEHVSHVRKFLQPSAEKISPSTSQNENLFKLQSTLL